MKLFGKRLPKVPTGFEVLDLMWSQMVPMAPGFLEVLPKSVDPVWGTRYGLLAVAAGLVQCEAAQAELQRTPAWTTLHRVRERRLKFLERRYQGLALTFMGALAMRARAEHAKASHAQVLTVVRDDFRELLGALRREAATWSSDSHSPVLGAS